MATHPTSINMHTYLNCPICGSSNVSHVEIEVTECHQAIFAKTECHQCQAKWTQMYSCRAVLDVRGPLPIPTTYAN